MTFRKLEERSRAFAAYLQQGLGLKKGDRVALMTESGHENASGNWDTRLRHGRRMTG